MSMSLHQLLGPWLRELPEANPEIHGLTLDSRQVRPGYAFVALPGSREHGITYAAQAHADGAVAVLIDPRQAADVQSGELAFMGVPDGLIPVVIPELRSHLGAMAAHFYGVSADQLTVIGVTGTNGKTSIVQLLAQALCRLGIRVGTQGTLGSGVYPALNVGERTTPDAIATQAFFAELLAAQASHVAMEVSSHALHQERVAGVRFRVAVLSNLSRDHLDYHGSMEAYGEAKARLFSWPELASAVINTDDAFGAALWQRTTAQRRISYGLAGGAEVRASALAYGPSGVSFTLHLGLAEGARTFAVQSPLLGRFNVYNLLAVAAALLALGVETDTIADVLGRLEPIHGRMNRLGGSNQPLVVVDYAHTPDGLEQALLAVRQHTSGRLTVVFGCGGDRDRGKRPLMGAIAARLADVCMVTDDNPRGEPSEVISAAILAGMAANACVTIEHDRERAIASAIAQARVGDVVLIAGKGHERYQEKAGRRVAFDDLEVARRYLQELAA